MVDWIQSVVGYVTSNWASLTALILQIIGAASVIVKLTPTLKDDDVLKGVMRFLGKYVALNTDKGSTP